MFYLLYHFEICEIWVFVDISISPFNFANMWSKYIMNPAASNVTDMFRKHYNFRCLWKSDAMTCKQCNAMTYNDMQWNDMQHNDMPCNDLPCNVMIRNAM